MEPFRPPPLSIAHCPRGQGELILLVDDDATVRFITSKILTIYGYQVITAENGAEGIGMFVTQRRQIALVISDLMMPVMDGPAMIRRLHATDPDARVIVVSGSLGSSDDLQFPEHGVLHFLEKPFTTDALLQVVHAALTSPVHH
jgi:CheY-like chemotaxis protein